MIKQIKEANGNIQPNTKALQVLKENFPSCFCVDGSFDIYKFKEFLSDKTNVKKEGYGLNFLGKNYGRLLASVDTTCVVEPDIEHNKKPENKDSENIYISGDNLDGLKILLKSYENKIKCIYIDPPYNTGSDGFVYNDKFNFTEEELSRKLSIDEEEAKRILDLTSRGSASHSAWLMFMYPRLLLARDLLTEDGVIFISIDDNEQANLKLLCDDVFGEENFAGTIPWRKRTAKSDVPFGVSQDFEWILVYAKSDFFHASIEGGNRKYFETPDFPNRPWRIHDITCQRTASERPNSYFTMINPKNGKEYSCNPNSVWRITKDTFQKYYDNNEIVFPGDYDFLKITKPVQRYFKDNDMLKDGEDFGKISVSTKLPNDIGMSQDGTKEIKALFNSITFSYPKTIKLIKHLIKVSSDSDSIILDFFSGSGTTGHAVMQQNIEDNWNRKFIMVQIQEPCQKKEAIEAGYNYVDQIGIERIIRASKKIREENPLVQADLGFKHYVLKEPNQDTLDKLEEFNPEVLFEDNDILEEFGTDTVLSTWLNQDGYGLTSKAEILNFNDYTAYYLKDHLYLIGKGITSEAIKAIVEKLENDSNFNPNNIVVFGYSFGWKMLEELKINTSNLRNTEKKVNIDIRY